MNGEKKRFQRDVGLGKVGRMMTEGRALLVSAYSITASYLANTVAQVSMPT